MAEPHAIFNGGMMSGMDPTFRLASHRCLDASDPWRSRMRRAAERLRLLDESRFQAEIARINESLRRDATWNLEAALASCDRWREASPPASSDKRDYVDLNQ